MNSGSDHLRGTTWSFIPRTPYAGTEIDWSNKRDVLKEKALEYKEKHPEATALECYDWAKRFVSREQKHYKNWLKGNNSYSYKEGRYLVEDELRVQKFTSYREQMEAKMAEYAEAEKQRELLNKTEEE